MAKTQKELAFLRDLYVQDEWTRRFTELVDKHIDLKDCENLLYISAGTGTHALTLDEKYGRKTDIFARCENEDLLMIARDKASATRAGVDFSELRFEDDSFDAVLADASLVRPKDLEEFIEEAVRPARVGASIAIFLPTAGSFGEVFSLLWEVLFSEDLGEHGAAVEKLLGEIPTVSALELMADRAGLVNVHAETVQEAFEYDNGAAFIASPLAADFLIPAWLEMLDDEERERASERLGQLIDEEDQDLSFRFKVKATMLSGEKG